MDSLSVGTSALLAARLGIETSGHNIANVNTPGYSRQRVVQVEAGSGLEAGGGVNIIEIQRLFNQFLNQELTSATSQHKELTEIQTYSSAMSDLIGGANTSLSKPLNDFFSALNQAATRPQDTSARQAVLSAAETLAVRLNTLQKQTDSLRTTAGQDLRDAVDKINTLSSQIAEYNVKITTADGKLTNDLLDQREELVRQLSEQVGVNVLKDKSGAYSITMSSGHTLVSAGTSFKLGTQKPWDSANTNDLELTYAFGTSQTSIPSAQVSGGRLAGAVRILTTDLTTVQQSLGQISIALAGAMNQQNKLGLDANGQYGGDIFSYPSPEVKTSPSNTSNTQLSASITDPSLIKASDYRVSWDGTNWQIANLNDGTKQSFLTLPQTVDGLNINVASGVAATGDSFVISATRIAAGALTVNIKDVAKLAFAMPIKTAANSANTGTGAISAGELDSSIAKPPLATSVPNLQQAVTIKFTSASSYDLLDSVGNVLVANQTLASNGKITYNGWAVNVTGSVRASDQFTVQSNVGGAADGRNVKKMADLITSKVVANGTFDVGGAYSAVVTKVGTYAQQVNVAEAAGNAVLTDVKTRIDSETGVSLDEEASNLLRYQQAYQAASKLIQVANQLFDTLFTAIA